MADKELIIGLLENVRRRVRSGRRFKIFSTGLLIALIFPTVFKLIDILSPFKGTQVTDEGLVHLKELAYLRSLQLEQTQVTDVGLANL